MDLLGKIFKSNSNSKIFVQIASYRDPELVPTIRSLIENCSNPDNLKVCILNQWHPDDNIDLSEWKDDPRFNIIGVEYDKTKGVCWARNILNQQYSGEKYTLQIDSHHRFIKNWDVELIDMLEGLIKEGIKKPLLTGYVPSYDPNNDPQERINTPWQLNFDKFIPEGAVFTLPAAMQGWQDMTSPRKTQFFSGHFVFTLGRFCSDVTYDPELYFHGEEITMAVRAFTNGYDMFTPHKVILWHEYTREGRIKQWDDDKEWHVKNDLSHDRVRKILGIDGKVCSPCLKKRLGVYYLGNERSKMEYETFAGLHFESRGVTTHTLDNLEPPSPKFETRDFYPKQRYEIQFPKNVLENEVEFDFWAIILQDKYGADIHRQDIDTDTIKYILEGSKDIVNIGGSYNGRDFHKWIVWPHKGDWSNKIEGIKI